MVYSFNLEKLISKYASVKFKKLYKHKATGYTAD